MIVISLVLVIAAAVSLFIGLFVVTETLTFIWGAIALCLVSLLLLWLGTRQRKGAGPTSPSAPVYGGAARAGGSTTPARTASGDDLDDLTAPDGGTVVRKTTARDRAATRVAADSGEPGDASTPAAEQAPVDAATADVTGDTQAVRTDEATTAAAAPTSATKPAKKAVARTSTKKATAKKATAKKSSARKSSAKKATAKKSTARKSSAKKATASKSARKSTAGTSGAAARARLAQIAGVGPAKQDALLAQFGSLESIRDASVDEIVGNVRGFGEALATRVKNELS